jgi:hypothetical protein
VEPGCCFVPGDALLCGSSWNLYQGIPGELLRVRQHSSIAHAKCQEGSKGGNGIWHVLGVLPLV